MGISRLWGRNEEMVMRYAVAERVVGMQTVRKKKDGRQLRISTAERNNGARGSCAIGLGQREKQRCYDPA